jgi:polyhydroxybutyrate depolymerase
MAARRSLRVALFACALALVLAGAVTRLGGVAPASRPAGSRVDPASACAARPGTTVRVSVAVDGQGARSALVHLPARRHGRLALILALHGAYGNAAFMESYSGLSRLADRAGYGVVYPDAAGPRWRIAASEGDTDVRFLDALLDRVLAGGCFDGRRVSAVGVSNGAGMAARFACAGDDRLAGVVAVAGDYGPLPACAAHRPLSVLEIHGTADAVVPYPGAVAGWLHQWVDRDACAPAPRSTRQRPNVLRLDWTRCRGGTSVAHLRLVGGAHAWPGGDPPDSGPQLGVSAADEAWEFLRGQRLTPAVAQHDGG